MPKLSLSKYLLKRAAGGPRSVGDKIELSGYSGMKFEVVDVITDEEETYYKVKPVVEIYGVPANMVKEERSSEIKPLKGKVRFPLSKRADESPEKKEAPIIPLGPERNKRVLKEIREENERKIREMGLDKPPEFPEGSTFFGEQFVPGDYIATRQEPNKLLKVTKRDGKPGGSLGGLVYLAVEAEEKHVVPDDVIAGWKGMTQYILPRDLWDVPGKGKPPKNRD